MSIFGNFILGDKTAVTPSSNPPLGMSQPLTVELMREHDRLAAIRYDLACFVDEAMEQFVDQDQDQTWQASFERALWMDLDTVFTASQPPNPQDAFIQHLFEFFGWTELPTNKSDYVDAIQSALIALHD